MHSDSDLHVLVRLCPRHEDLADDREDGQIGVSIAPIHIEGDHPTSNGERHQTIIEKVLAVVCDQNPAAPSRKRGLVAIILACIARVVRRNHVDIHGPKPADRPCGNILVGIQAQPPWVGQPSSPLDLLATAALVRHPTMEADAYPAKARGCLRILFPVCSPSALDSARSQHKKC